MTAIPSRSAISKLALAVLAATACQRAEAATVSFKSQASASSTLITLGDVAEIADADPQVVERLQRITLSPAPGAGRTLRLDFNNIRSRLVAQGADLATIEFTGSSVIEVSTSGGPAPAPARPPISPRAEEAQRTRAETLVGDAVSSYLRGVAPELGLADVSIELSPEDVPSILEGVGSGFHVAGGTPPWNMPQLMSVSFQDRAENIRRISVTCRIAPKPHVLVARHTIQRGQVLGEADLAWQQTDGPSNAITRAEDALGLETTRTLRQGEALRLDDVQATELVRSNDIVKTYVRKGSITITSYLKSRSSGAMGDTVTLVTLDGRERLLARVTGPHEAEVLGSPNGNLAPAPGIRLISAERDAANSRRIQGNVNH